jgi:hypothetical protein
MNFFNGSRRTYRYRNGAVGRDDKERVYVSAQR